MYLFTETPNQSASPVCSRMSKSREQVYFAKLSIKFNLLKSPQMAGESYLRLG